MSRGTQDPENVEFTLEDAYENLKDIEEDMKQELEDRIHRESNNVIRTLNCSATPDDMKNRRRQLLQGLAKNLRSSEHPDLPIPNTIDLHQTTIQDFQKQINEMQIVADSLKNDNARVKKNIASLESNLSGLEKMKIALSSATENVGSKITYDKEIAVIKRLFAKSKNDLQAVVNTIFPDNDNFHELLAELSRTYMAGGDDVYVDVEPESLPFAKFLVEGDIAVYHRNDKSKIKLVDVI